MIIGKYKITGDNMDVTLTEEYEIKEDSKAYLAGDTTARKKGDKVYNNPKFFANVKQALRWIVNKDVNTTGLEDLETVVKKIDELEEKIGCATLFDPVDDKNVFIKPSQEAIEKFFNDGPDL